MTAGEYRTRTGRVLTDADLEAMAAEAERGYDLPARSGRPEDPSPEFRQQARRFMAGNDELLRRLASLPDPCPQCGEADLEPFGGKHRCPACFYLQPCCQPLDRVVQEHRDPGVREEQRGVHHHSEPGHHGTAGH